MKYDAEKPWSSQSPILLLATLLTYRPSLKCLLSVCVMARVCDIFMSPTSKKLVGHIASGTFVHACIHPSVCPPVTLFDALHNFWTVHARVLKFHISILHEKIADRYLFSHQDYAPFLSYGPLKKYRWNLVSKISQKLLKLARALKPGE